MYAFDDSRRPLVVVQLYGPIDGDDVARLKADLDALVDRVEPFVIVFDLARLEIPGREVVMDIVRWTQGLRGRYKELYEDRPDPLPSYTAYCLSPRTAAMLRFFEQMIPWLRVQQGYFSALDEAIAACEQAARRLGLEVPKSPKE